MPKLSSAAEQAQNAMLERLLDRCELDPELKTFRDASLAFGRELLLAVQRNNSKIAKDRGTHEGTIIAQQILAETYADLFLKEE